MILISDGKESACSAEDLGSIPRKSNGQRSLEGYSPCGCKD